LLALPVVLAGCAAGGVRPLADAGADGQAGRPADRSYVVVRSWEHELKQPDGSLERQVVEYGWDYARAVAVERTRHTDGEATGEREVVGETLRATEEEQAWAFDLVRREPSLQAAATAPDVLLYGGFILMEPGDPHCHLQSRCVYVFASQGNESRKVVEAIVDLQANRVVYPNYKPETTRPLN
jgi:hypothetical protein